MKIKQLIKKLQKLDQNMEVYYSDTELHYLWKAEKAEVGYVLPEQDYAGYIVHPVAIEQGSVDIEDVVEALVITPKSPYS